MLPVKRNEDIVKTKGCSSSSISELRAGSSSVPAVALTSRYWCVKWQLSACVIMSRYVIFMLQMAMIFYIYCSKNIRDRVRWHSLSCNEQLWTVTLCLKRITEQYKNSAGDIMSIKRFPTNRISSSNELVSDHSTDTAFHYSVKTQLKK